MFNKLKRNFYHLYTEYQFIPGVWAMFLNPHYIVRRNIYYIVEKYSDKIFGNVIDIGCGTKPYERLFDIDSYTGLEYSETRTKDSSAADIFYSGGDFPFENEKFDSAVCFQVLEHVFKADDFIAEINRVLKINGKLMLTVPFVWPLHEAPHDFGRYTEYGLAEILKRNGFDVEIQKKITSGVGMLLIMWLSKISIKFNKIPFKIKIIIEFMFYFPFNLLLLLITVPENSKSDLYFDNFIIARKR